jgi:nucleotide-binding universal stress UspA family protein
MTPTRIIAAITFAEDSLEAAAIAASLAESLGAELVLAGIAPLAADEETDGDGSAPASEQQLVDHLIGTRLEQFRAALAPGIRARTRMTWGPVGAALVSAAADEGADLVVVPSRRESRVAHPLHDRVERYVLHHSDVPVLVVPTSGHAAQELPKAA